MKHLDLALAALLLFLAVPGASGAPMPPDVEVPVERLVANLERMIQQEPLEAWRHAALGRVHAIAYALKTETLLSPWGEESAPRSEPWKTPVTPLSAEEEERRKAALAHLEKAILSYEKAAELAPEDMLVQLALGWCRAEKGEKEPAIASFRRVFESAWEKEKDLKVRPMWTFLVACEAAGCLLPLLDPEKDAEEIALLKERKAHLEGLPFDPNFPISPILVPLAGGLALGDLVDPEPRVPFDLEGSGVMQEWGWIRDTAAWLVYDPCGKGDIRSGHRLFGNVTFGVFWEDGYQALSALDDDGDGRLAGQELAGLALWRDANANGRSEPGEVRPLADWGIEALSCRRENHEAGIPFSPEGVLFRDGTTRPTYDWYAPGRPILAEQELFQNPSTVGRAARE
ncbi:MAG: hypothetical protein HY720_08135 [Planctomycetes bacterium]|nr:hypothetical protein [Planctomycetota bacterium]